MKHSNNSSLELLLFILISLNGFLISCGLSIAGGERDSKKLFGGYKITPKFCMESKMSKADMTVNGPAICMFNHECVERRGTVIGACMDGFLFGTCCHLSGEIETSLANAIKQSNNLSQLPSEKQEPLGKKPQIVNNNFYTGAADESDEQNSYDENSNFKVSNGAVHISSPAYSSSYYPTEATKTTSIYGSSQSYATELPSRIHMSTTLSDETNEMHNSIQFSKDPYDHSDISYVPSDSEILMEDDDDNHINSYVSSTSEPDKNKYSKPFFKLKPTSHPPTPTVTEKYVLVHTISNEKPNGESSQQLDALTRKPVSSENDSIQSILLQLNENTNPGPEYDVESTHSNVNYSPISVSTPSYGSTTMIDREKYGVTSYYITTKVPSSTTKKPSKITTNKLVTKLKVTPTKSSVKLTTPPNIPSTSYVYSPNPIRKRPTAAAATQSPTTFVTSSSSTSSIIKKGTTNGIIKKTTTTGKPINLIKKPTTLTADDNGGYVVISGGGITKHPSPTVHITPKPITNILTASTLQQLPKKPSGTTERPYFSSTPSAIISSSIYLPQNQDFNNEGYFVVSHQPGGNVVSSTAVYSIINNQPTNVKITGNLETGNYGQQDHSVISNDDLTNFPPVRNPNLNMTASNAGGIMDESEISTPQFVEDEHLNNKIDLLVSKLVASMQGNLDNLMDIVYERKNVSSVEGAIKNGTGSVTENTKPNKTTKIPVSTTKPPSRVTTGRPSQTTTKKAPTKSTTSTKKPSSATKRPSVSSSSSSSTTRRPPQRGTTASTLATKRPTKRTTTTTSTERAPEVEDDEIIEEEGAGDVEEENENEVNEEDNLVEENETDAGPPPLENGRTQCGVRPHIKSGRIVGGKASAFGEFPWQVLVRESTWLGLFTKNKCGGVLISNSYVITAAHCQPGFLASLVAVFGEYDISGDLETKRSVSKNVKRVIVHRQYDAATFENDLAILELESPVRYDTHIVPICMPPDGADFTSKVATVSGWGRLKYGGGVPSVLQEVQVPIIENKICQEMFAAAGHSKKILPSFLCAGYANGQKDSCEGDSGGPLVIQRSDGRYELVGTVSHGIKCASPLLPGVYMRTNFYKPWIKSVTAVK